MKILRKISFFSMLLVISIFLMPANIKAATVGEQLKTPETGWKRYDERDSSIVYTGTDWTKKTFNQYFNQTISYTSSADNVIKFKFKGTKIRIISNKNTAAYRGLNYISIDGVIDSYSEISSNEQFQIIVYEKTELTDGIHTVIMHVPDDGKLLVLDAIDIDNTGYLVNYYQPTNLVANPGIEQIILSWDAVEDTTSYNIKRSTTPGGPYKTIATSSGSAITYTDKDVTPGTTYYYVVSSIVSGKEILDSNEASATPTEVQTSKLKVVLEVNEELQLSVDDDLDENLEMTWTSSDNTVATVDGNGVVTALAPGNTVITVTSADGTYTDYINVLVVENAKDYRLAVDLKVGKSCRLTVDDDLTDTVNVTWNSMDPTVATVSSNGKVTGVSKGLTLITVTDDEGSIIGQVYVRVRNN